jgi:hypothetical protein
VREKREPVFLVQINCDLGITFTAKLVAFSAECFPDLGISIKLAVDHSMHITFGIMEWLFSFRIQVNNRKTVVSEGYTIEVRWVTCLESTFEYYIPTRSLSLIH